MEIGHQRLFPSQEAWSSSTNHHLSWPTIRYNQARYLSTFCHVRDKICMRMTWTRLLEMDGFVPWDGYAKDLFAQCTKCCLEMYRSVGESSGIKCEYLAQVPLYAVPWLRSEILAQDKAILCQYRQEWPALDSRLLHIGCRHIIAFDVVKRGKVKPRQLCIYITIKRLPPNSSPSSSEQLTFYWSLRYYLRTGSQECIPLCPILGFSMG